MIPEKVAAEGQLCQKSSPNPSFEEKNTSVTQNFHFQKQTTKISPTIKKKEQKKQFYEPHLLHYSRYPTKHMDTSSAKENSGKYDKDTSKLHFSGKFY